MATGHDSVHARWVAALDGLAAEVARVAAGIHDDDGPPAPRWRAPSGLGPLPETLAARAADVLERLGVVRDLLVRQRDHVAGDAIELTARRRASAAYRATDHASV